MHLSLQRTCTGPGSNRADYRATEHCKPLPHATEGSRAALASTVRNATRRYRANLLWLHAASLGLSQRRWQFWGTVTFQDPFRQFNPWC